MSGTIIATIDCYTPDYKVGQKVFIRTTRELVFHEYMVVRVNKNTREIEFKPVTRAFRKLLDNPLKKGKPQPAYATQFHQRKGGDPSAKSQRLKLPYALTRSLPRERPALKPGNYG